MSLVAFAVRYCFVKAMQGQTLAEDDVFDAPLDVEDLAKGVTKPMISVFTDTEANVPDARSLVQGTHLQDLEYHVMLPTALMVTIDGVNYEFQGRNSGAALVIDIIQRQVQRTLMVGQSVWAVLWRRIVTKINQADTRAYVLQVGTNTGIRIPARQTIFRCDTLADPEFGIDPTGFWADFIAALEADPDSAILAPLVKAVMVGGEYLPQWRTDAAEMGLSTDEARAIGMGPQDGSDDTMGPAPIVQITLTDLTQPGEILNTDDDEVAG